MNPQVYYFLHIAGGLLVFLSYGMLLGRSWLADDNRGLRKFGGILSGIGLFLILLGGFGLLARVYQNQWYPWVILKLVIWVVLGGLLVLINRKPGLSKVLVWVTYALGLLAAWAAYFKPGM
jgi:uncharacterized membrane protein SirB2